MSDGAAAFTPLPAAALLDAHLMCKRTILEPILTEADLALLYGPRGIGKSFLALGIAWALAAGREFLKWRALGSQRVLYLDGELAGVDLQRRLASLGPPPPKLHFLTAGMQGRTLPDLCRGEGDRMWEPWMEDGFPKLLVVDSLSSVVGET
ncbi:MAG: AAA family ATPase, partial [Alphaproteobacteria bacterium]|nr:AAA family ATPase [Alphaproteobacteria bacterium]